MTYPRVTIRGTDLPEPFTGWDDREYSTGAKAVYFPTAWEIKPDAGLVYFEWVSDETHEQRWLSLDTIDSIDSIDSTHDHSE